MESKCTKGLNILWKLCELKYCGLLEAEYWETKFTLSYKLRNCEILIHWKLRDFDTVDSARVYELIASVN